MKNTRYFPLFALAVIFALPTFAQIPGAGRAIELDGSDDYIEIPDRTPLNPTDVITVEAWIKPDAFGSNSFDNSIVCKHDWVNGNRGYVLRCGDNGKLSFNIANSSGVWVEAISASVMTTGNWYHVAGVFDGTAIKVYINGNLEGTTSYTGSMIASTGTNARIGQIAFDKGGSRLFDGQIDEVRLWHQGLTQTQIRDWMCRKASTSHPAINDIIVYYKLDESSGSVARDSSANAIHANLINGPRWVVSTAAIGDRSSYTYAAAQTTHASGTGDRFTARNFSTKPKYIHIYSIEQTSQQSMLKSLPGYFDSTHYFGVYCEPASGTTFDVHYDFSQASNISGNKKCAVQILTKTVGIQGNWSGTPQFFYENGDSIRLNGQTRLDFIPAFYESNPSKLISTGVQKPWLCTTDSIQLIAQLSDSLTYKWYMNGKLLTDKTKNSCWAATPGVYKVVIQRKGTSCTFESIDLDITDKRPAVSWSQQLNTCQNSDSIALQTGTPSGGVFFGTGVSNTYFHPSNSGAGNHTITYQVTDGFGCVGKAISTFVVKDTTALNVTNPTAVCPESDPFAMTFVTPSTGKYAGSGVSHDVFYPLQSGSGNHEITYTYTSSNGCGSHAVLWVEVHKPDSIDISMPAKVCANADPFNIQLYPSGGTLFHSAVSGVSFIPGFAQTGKNGVIYSMTESHGCKVSDSAEIDVLLPPSVSLLAADTVCAYKGNLALNSGTPSGGIYFVNGIQTDSIDPSDLGAGTHQIVYQVTDNQGCIGQAQGNMVVNQAPAKPIVTISSNILFASGQSGFQWFFNGNLIPGAVNQSHKPAADGKYKVTITNAFGCMSESDEVQFVKLSNRGLLPSGVDIYPNPAVGELTIKGLTEGSFIQLITAEGQVLKSLNIESADFKLNLSDLTSGAYLIRIVQAQGIYHHKFNVIQ